MATGAKPGERRGVRAKGVPNKATVARLLDAKVAEKVEAITRAMVRVFEEYISRYPAQWFAFYKVWG